jgi:hypothetical protein
METSMNRLLRARATRVAAIPALAGMVTAFTVLATPVAASAGTNTASAGSKITVRYPVTGSTFLKAVNSSAPLGPGTLTSTVDLVTGALTANLVLPPASVSFKQLGLIPVTATTAFIQNGATTGKLNVNTGAVSTTSHITLRVTALSVAGLPLPVPPGCQSASPATVTVNSQPGFNVVNGGNLSGTYTIPPFAHCGLLTPLLNLTVPGPGNTITLTLGAGQRVG